MANLQAMIDQANKRTQAGRAKQFVKKATDAQMLAELLAAAKGVALASGGKATEISKPLWDAICNLEAVVKMAERRTK